MNSFPLNLTVSDRQALLSGSNFKFTIEKKSMQEFASQLNARDLKSYMDDFDSLIKDPHQFHANTKFIPESEDAVRMTIIYYFREGILKCHKITF